MKAKEVREMTDVELTAKVAELRTQSLFAARLMASLATASLQPEISKRTRPGSTGATQPSTAPFPLPIRTSNGFLVKERKGNMRIQTLPRRLR